MIPIHHQAPSGFSAHTEPKNFGPAETDKDGGRNAYHTAFAVGCQCEGARFWSAFGEKRRCERYEPEMKSGMRYTERRREPSSLKKDRPFYGYGRIGRNIPFHKRNPVGFRKPAPPIFPVFSRLRLTSAASGCDNAVINLSYDRNPFVKGSAVWRDG